MTAEYSEITDAVKLVFDDDYEGIVGLTSDEIVQLNATGGDSSQILGGSLREMSTYDPLEKCQVTAREFIGVGKDTPNAEITDGHGVFLWWEKEDIEFLIDRDTGTVFAGQGDEKGFEVDFHLKPEWFRRIIGALGILADKKLGLDD